MDSIYIEDLKVQARIGVFKWEYKVEQRLDVSVKLFLDLASAGASDDLEHTLDYAAIAQTIQQHGQQHYQLIERYGETLCQRMLQDTRVQKVELTIHKPAALPQAQKIGVHLIRSRVH